MSSRQWQQLEQLSHSLAEEMEMKMHLAYTRSSSSGAKRRGRPFRLLAATCGSAWLCLWLWHWAWDSHWVCYWARALISIGFRGRGNYSTVLSTLWARLWHWHWYWEWDLAGSGSGTATGTAGHPRVTWLFGLTLCTSTWAASVKSCRRLALTPWPLPLSGLPRLTPTNPSLVASLSRLPGWRPLAVGLSSSALKQTEGYFSTSNVC